MKRALQSTMCALVVLVAVRTVTAQEGPSAITVFTAKKIVTMDPTNRDCRRRARRDDPRRRLCARPRALVEG
jgi:hypothetical protein